MTRRRRHLRTKRATPIIDRILAESQPVHDTVKRTDDPDIERAQWAALWSKKP